MHTRQQLSRISPFTIGIVLLFAAVMTYFLFRAFAASGTATLYTSPGGTQAVTTGQTFTVNVRVSTAGNVPVTGAAVYMSYPTNKLQVIGESYAGSPYSTQLIASDSSGVLRMDRAAFPMISGGDQLFAQVSFKAIAAGMASVNFTGSSLVTSGEDDSNILTQQSGVTYNIAAPAAAPPSPGGGSGSSSGNASSSGSHASGSASSGGSKAAPGQPSGTSSNGGSTSNGGASSTTNSGSGENADSLPISSATSVIAVTVLDSKNKPVTGADVVINGQTIKTDKNGVARFRGVPVGSQAVTIKYNGKKTSKTLQVKDTASKQSPQLFKVSITRDKFNPVLLLVPVVILALAGVFFVRPWDGKFAPVPAKDDAPQIVSSGQPQATLSHKLEAPGTIYAPTSGDTPSPPSQNSSDGSDKE